MTRPDIHQPLPHLGGLTAQQFMRRHWQKKPLFVKGAFAQAFSKDLPVTQADLIASAQSEGLPSRLVQGRPMAGGSIKLTHGPLRPRQIPSLQRPGWTILIQQLNTAWPAADAFLDHFRFIPEGRLDDLMASLASKEGGIGAHVDSYDVFLIQAQGVRQWEVARDFDETLLPDLPLKVLADFEAEETFICEPGDLLYLPPGLAHRGVARDAGCMTYSVGFRAPEARELADDAFGQHIDAIEPSPWTDPWLSASEGGGVLPDRLVTEMARAAEACLPSRDQLAEAVVVSLSRPHPSIWAEPPNDYSDRQFAARLKRCKTLALAPGARLMVWKNVVACNGERLHVDTHARETMSLLTTLAKERSLSASDWKGQAENPVFMRVFKTCYDLGALIVL